MTRPSLKSRFGEQIRAFVGYKNSLGFPYDESIRILGRFDDFCVERFPEKDCLDCELALAWLEKRDTENTAGHRNRIMVIREFAKYLRAVGTEAYMIPISMTSKGPGYVPHIFNEAEIKAFFTVLTAFGLTGKLRPDILLSRYFTDCCIAADCGPQKRDCSRRKMWTWFAVLSTLWNPKGTRTVSLRLQMICFRL